MKPKNATHRQVLRSRRVLTQAGLRPADIVLREGVIEEILEHGTAPPTQARQTRALQDFGDAVVMAALADVHCHINEPGRTDWEGFRTATRAAAAGGITLLVDMPLNSEPVTTSAHALDTKIKAALSSGDAPAGTAPQTQVDVAFYGGVVPSNAMDEQALAELSRSGAAAFKCFLCDSGLKSFPAVDKEHLAAAMPQIARLGKRLLAHAELFDPPTGSGPTTHYHDFLRARPCHAEERAIELLAELCESTGCAVHIVHLSAAAALPRLQALRARGVPITVETCPHYLTFCDEDIAPEQGPLDVRFKCTPPIREAANREHLWQGLSDGIIDFVASDHSPCPPDLKGEWDTAWGGIASLQLLLPALWTEAKKRGYGIGDIAQWLSKRPTEWLGCTDRGQLAPGYRADLVVWHPERRFTVQAQSLHHRHAITPYDGLELLGTVECTLLQGQPVYGLDDHVDSDVDPDAGPKGQPLRLRRGHASHYPKFQAFANGCKEDQLAKLQTCCGSSAWLHALSMTQPFASADALFTASEKAFDRLEEVDWREAFSAHPRIGDIGSLREKFAATKAAASAEQAGVRTADEVTLEALAKANEHYEDRFGHVFLICASGKSANQMLSALNQRMNNQADQEIHIAAEEQRKITFLRLERLLATG